LYQYSQEYESDLEDEDEEEGERRRRKKRKQKRPTKTIFDEFEPDELERRHYTDRDNEIRNTDIPERMQLRDPPVTAVPEGSDELDRESEWIYKYHFCKPTLSRQDGFTRDICQDWSRKPGALEKIRNAVDFIRQGNEPPFIAFYRKEYVQPELNINDLWRIFHADGLW
jgi:transcription elongation factor SPT6